uniref:Uncharacterized protein n=1 Tax=Lotharella oceanica TaxID=641309 RepID=A0A7S2TZA3_9EUKA
MSAGMWPGFMYEIQKKYLANQGMTTPGVVVMIPALGVNFLCNFLLVPRIGFAGASVSIVTSLWLMNVLLFLYIRCRSLHKKTWPRGGWRDTGWDARCLRQWSEMFKLGTPGALMLVLEWGIFEVNAFLAARLGANALACHSILTQTAGLFYMLPLGIGVAVTTLVGNALGEAQPEVARRYMYVGLGVGALLITVQGGVVCFILRGTWPALFTNDETVVKMVTDILPWFALFAFPDEMQGIMAGAFRSMGRQMLGAKINGICYPFVGLTLSYILSDTLKGGILGIWQGLICAVTLTFFLYAAFLVCFADWERESRIAVRRAGKKDRRTVTATHGDDDIEFSRIASLGSSDAALFRDDNEDVDVDGDDVNRDCDDDDDDDDTLRRATSDVSLDRARSSMQLIGGRLSSESDIHMLAA